MPPPNEDTWKQIEFGFRTCWNFPNCVGAIDGKHIALQAPANNGSLYFNYKNHFSVVLMALVDHAYKFIFVDVGNYGSNSDLGIFKHSAFGLKFMAEDLQIPDRKMLPGFPQAGLLPHCMKPFPRGMRGNKLPEDQLVFNYRLSHACRISENAFGILVQKWRVFDRWMYLSDENAIKVIQAATVLHNYLTPAHFNVETMMAQLNPEAREYDHQAGALTNVNNHRGMRSPTDAMEIRNCCVVLMALVDHAYKFIFVDVGNYGSNSDLGIFKHSDFGLKFMAEDLQIPDRKMLPGFPQAGLLPHCIVQDEAFPLRPDLMKPFPRGMRGNKLPEDQLVFNYRLSHACRISENAFGILVQKWRVFDRWMYLSDENAIKVIQAATVLHNYLTPAHFNYRLSHACRISENAFGILVQKWRVFDRWMYLSDENAIKVIQAATVLHNY